MFECYSYQLVGTLIAPYEKKTVQRLQPLLIAHEAHPQAAAYTSRRAMKEKSEQSNTGITCLNHMKANYKRL